ncbi:hypothetical protein FOCC_FOCC002946 [Frankliniella occidentalis]|nr:hypothetical protein FOCC_FOCC002946 [Frankliniella occidentalis]
MMNKSGYEPHVHPRRESMGPMGGMGVRAHVREVLGMRRSSALLLLFLFFYLGYLVAGGLVFATIEAPAEAQLKGALVRARQAFLEKHPCVSDSDLELLLKEVVWAADRGVSAVNNVTGQPNWSFGQSIFFSSTVVTTIGQWGTEWDNTAAPHSGTGKEGGGIRSCDAALQGGQAVLHRVRHLRHPADARLVHGPGGAAARPHHAPPAVAQRAPRAPVPALLHPPAAPGLHRHPPANMPSSHPDVQVSLFLLIPAAVYASLEPEWDYMDALYYCFISLTTIGLGDYIPGDYPGQAYRPLYKVLTTVYLLVGLTFTMLTLAVFCDIPQLNVGLLFMARSDETTTDPEKVRLNQPAVHGPGYTQQRVHVRARLDSPSPEEVTPVHARP